MTTTPFALAHAPITAQRPTTAPRTKPFVSESALSLYCSKRIKTEWGGEAFNVHGGGTAQKTGQPDLICCVRGRMVCIELKQPDAKKPYPTDLQYKRLRDWRDAGALAGWATSPAEVDALLERLDDLDWENPQLTPAGIAGRVRLLEPV